MSDQDEVGYGKPPKHTRFAKGQSGNPRGRPKGSKNVATIFRSVGRETIRVTENGRTRRMTKIEAMLIQIFNKALAGNLPAAKEVMSWNRIFDDENAHADIETPDREKNRIVLAGLLQRLREGSPEPDDTEPNTEDEPEETE
jgi:hypothetical protein